jgi:hypothetical protein
VETFCRAGQATDDNMAHAHSMLDTLGYKYAHCSYVTLIAFPQQQSMQERASMLHYTYFVCPVIW